MNSASPELAPPTSTPGFLTRWLGRLRKLALFVAAIAVLLGLIYGVENFRGWRELRAEMDRVKASGRGVRLEEVIPPPIPDEQNFALSPVMKPVLDLNPDRQATNRWRDPAGARRAQDMFGYWKVNGNSREPELADAVHGRPISLVAWQSYFRAPVQPRATVDNELRQRYGLPPVSVATAEATNTTPAFPLPATVGKPADDVLRALAVFAPDYTAIHEALQRPDCRYPLAYEDGYATLLPHLARLKRFAMSFALRASARLEAGDVPGAFADIEDILKLGETLKTEPFFISQLVRQACHNLALGAFWQGQLRHLWTAPQLTSIQARLAAMDMLAGLRKSLAIERVGFFRSVERMGGSFRERREFLELATGLFDGHGQQNVDPRLPAYVLFAPRGWLFASAVAFSRAIEQLETVELRDLSRLRAEWVERTDSSATRLLLHHLWVRSEFLDGFANSTVRSHRNALGIRLAEVSCALERHHRASGTYPEELASLVPALLPSLPQDPVTGTALRYRREAGDRFRLWSVGEDGRDNSGTWPERRTHDREPESGDWVWGWPDAPVD